MAQTDPRNALLFLGSGNAFGTEGRAFSSFLLDGRYLFDAGPTVLQQLNRAGLSTAAIEAIFISHFHGDHFFGLPFLFLDAWKEQRQNDLWLVGPPGIQERAEGLMETAFPNLPAKMTSFARRYLEVQDGIEAEVRGLPFTAAQVDHAPGLDCFAYQVRLGSHVITYSGDTKLCEGLLRVVPAADVLVIECSCQGDPVHMSPAELGEVRRHARPDARVIITHIDSIDDSPDLKGVLVASDLARFEL